MILSLYVRPVQAVQVKNHAPKNGYKVHKY